MALGGIRPPRDPFASWMGRVRVGRSDESWPVLAGLPLRALAQINTVELPERPNALRGVALLVLFADSRPDADPPGLVRAYASLADLVPLSSDQALAAEGLEPTPISWEPIESDDQAVSKVGGFAQPPLEGADGGSFVLQIREASQRWLLSRTNEEWQLVRALR